MRTLASAVTTASVTLLAADVAHAAGPDFFGIPARWWVLLVVILLILNLLCCLRKR